ncbi:SAM-dependent methyltransferase [Membranihabitans maritimus]|uniref:SAM-dependent methyltransferase n=1 Tax=Membranihabitans maritimus TaxID=2904244 RepID=UPI001F2ED864|nr:SAM-dependent methyltransferase [Membranihabitans maritimus]
MKKQTLLYLIPTALGDNDHPHETLVSILPSIEVFICERIRTTRRWLRSINPDFDIDNRIFVEYNKHDKSFPWQSIYEHWENGKVCGLTSEAGTPAIADPGYGVVYEAHLRNVPVIPLPGNNSIILALMASGFNGNKFSFNGYFPIDNKVFNSEIKKAIKETEKGYTQIYIETPYRNVKTLNKLLNSCPGEFKISISSDLFNNNNTSKTRSVNEWKKVDKTYLDKIPAIFILGTS